MFPYIRKAVARKAITKCVNISKLINLKFTNITTVNSFWLVRTDVFFCKFHRYPNHNHLPMRAKAKVFHRCLLTVKHHTQDRLDLKRVCLIYNTLLVPSMFLLRTTKPFFFYFFIRKIVLFTKFFYMLLAIKKLFDVLS